MNSKKVSLRSRPRHALLGAALLGLLVMPLAVAGAADGPSASASGAGTAKVKKQLRKLQQRVAQLEAQGPVTPSGPAGGDLAGEYPEPVIAPNAIGSEEVIDDSLTGDDIAPSSVNGTELSLDSVGSLALVADSVGASELKGVTARVGAGAASNGTFVDAVVTCQAGEMLINGGFAWTNDNAGNSITHSVMAEPGSGGNPNTTWVVRGRSPVANQLFAWASCLQV